MAHAIPQPLLREVDWVVSGLRRCRDRRPDRLEAFRINRVAGRARVEVRRRALGDTLLGLTLDADRVLVNSRLSAAEANFTFAHELAHILLRRGCFARLPASREEWFADRFAHELLLPRRWVWGASADEVRWLSQRRWLAVETLAIQLGESDRVPSVFRSRGRVYCRRCSHRHVLPGCECRLFRAPESRPRAIERLPDITVILASLMDPVGQQNLPVCGVTG